MTALLWISLAFYSQPDASVFRQPHECVQQKLMHHFQRCGHCVPVPEADFLVSTLDALFAEFNTY